MVSANLRARRSGFSLIELMIVLVVIAILAAIALPSYTDYLRRGRITEATAGLSNKRARVELYFDNNHTYINAPDCSSDSSTSKYFTFSCSASSASGYTLQAVGTDAMTGFTYTVNQLAAKTTTISGVSGWTGSTTCWVTNKGGIC